MKAVIAAKASSSRVPEKNFRKFAGGRSLVELAAGQLLRVLDPADVFMSCEDPARKDVADRLGIGFLPRDPHLADNATPMTDVLRGVVRDLPGDDDVVWVQVCDPLFDEYARCIEVWADARARHDSLVVVHPVRGYLLDERFRPDGYGFGPWHVPSTELPRRYLVPFNLSILTRESLDRVGYHVGERPYWYVGGELTVDIDTPEDFELAQVLYGHYRGDGRG